MERGLLWMTRHSFHLYDSVFRKWGPEVKYFKNAPIALIIQKVPRVWGSVIQEPWYILFIWMTKYIYFLWITIPHLCSQLDSFPIIESTQLTNTNIWHAVHTPSILYQLVCFSWKIDYAKASDSVASNKLWKILKDMGIPGYLTASWEIYMQIKKKQNQTWSNRLVPNWERSTSRLYIITLLI